MNILQSCLVVQCQGNGGDNEVMEPTDKSLQPSEKKTQMNGFQRPIKKFSELQLDAKKIQRFGGKP